MQNRLAIALSVITALALASAPAIAQTPLGDADIRSEIVGKSFLWSDGGVARYDSSGEYSYTRANGQASRGKWTVGGGQMCVDFTGGNIPQRCFKFAHGAQGLQVTIWNGSVFQLTPASAEAAAQGVPGVLNACEQTIRYSIVPPANDVPPDAKAYSGVWVGTWDGGLCSALIVQNVTANGAAQVLYVVGSLAQWGIKAGNTGFGGKVAGNAMSGNVGNSSLNFILASPSTLSGRFTNPSGVYNGRFTRK